MKEYFSLSPLKILEKSSRKELGPGNLGVLLARAGAGKTACLIHIALKKIFQHKKLVHVSLEEGPEKIVSYYDVIYSDILKALEISDDPEFRTRMDTDRIILAYLNKSFELERLQAGIKNLTKEIGFIPTALIVDGLDFEKTERATFKEFKEFAEKFNVEIWFSALSHRHISRTNERGIPYPCNEIDDLFSMIMQLEPESSHLTLKLLKDHDNATIKNIRTKLNPSTFLSV